MIVAKFTTAAAIGAVATASLTTPFYRIYEIADQAPTKEQAIIDIAETPFNGFYKDFFKTLKSTMTKELLVLYSGELLKAYIPFSDPVLSFLFGGGIGLARTFLTYPMKYADLYLKRKKIAGTQPASVKDSASAFRYIFIKKGFIGLYNNSKLEFAETFLKFGMNYLCYTLIDSLFPFKPINLLIRAGLSIVSHFGISVVLACLSKARQQVEKRFKQGETDINSIKELSFALFELTAKQVHHSWTKTFWVDAIGLATGIMAFNFVLKIIKSR